MSKMTTNEMKTNVSSEISNYSNSNSHGIRSPIIAQTPDNLPNGTTNHTRSQSVKKTTPTTTNKGSTSVGNTSVLPPFRKIAIEKLVTETSSISLLSENPMKTNNQTTPISIKPNSKTNESITTEFGFSNSTVKTLDIEGRFSSLDSFLETTTTSTNNSTPNSFKEAITTERSILKSSSIVTRKSGTDPVQNTTERKIESTAKTTKQHQIENERILTTTSQTVGSSKSTNISLTTSKSLVKGILRRKTERPTHFTDKIPINQKKAISNTFYPIESRSSMSDFYLGTTKEPAQTMGAGALVIVVLLPFLALFLIAVVTALRRKMKKSSRRTNRYPNRNAEAKLERNQSQMVPLTKSIESD